MGRKKKKKRGVRIFFEVKEKTRYWIFSILSFLGALFFVLAATEKAGIAGNLIYESLEFFFGLGYFLFPIILVSLGFVFLRGNRPSFILTPLMGSFLLFFSGLSIVGLLQENGGVIGKIISSALVSFLDFYTTLVILVAVFIISLLLIFDTTPSSNWFTWILRLFKRKKTDETEYENDDEEYAGDDEEEMEEENLDGEKDNNEHDKEDAGKQTGGLKDLVGWKQKTKKSGSVIYSAAHDYSPPPLSLLEGDSGKPGYGDIKANSNIIKRTLQNFGITVEMDEISVGPTVTRYALKPAQGVKLSRIVGLQNDLSLSLAAHPIRIEAPIPGKSLVGIEIPNSSRTTVGLNSLLSAEEYQNSENPLLISIGRGITGKPQFGNLAKMPHLLIAGSTGSGKSVSIHAIIVSLLYHNAPSHLRFIMIDPKRVELTLYNNTPHLLTPVITDAKKAILALKWAAKEMERRYDVFETESVRDIISYHKNIVEPAYANSKASAKSDDAEEDPGLPEQMPYIVIIMDELADIMSAYPRELESAVVRLAQMSRAVGIHLILSTQRPEVKVITGLIKANIPARMAFQVASQTDSRTILDMGGAEKLLGAGDMLYISGEMSKPVRLQSAFISENEIKKVVKFLSKKYDEPEYDISFSESENGKESIFDIVRDDKKEDELYEEAREIIVLAGKASTTFLQRKLRVGYARAARLMDILEERGVVGPGDGAKPREILGQNTEGYGELDEDVNEKDR